MIFNEPDLRRINVHHVAWKGEDGSCGVEDILHVTEQLVDILAGDSQPGLLVLVELSWMSLIAVSEFRSGMNPPSDEELRGVICPFRAIAVNSNTVKLV